MPRSGAREPPAAPPTADVSTATALGSREEASTARPVPALTLVSHPTATRAGERLLLHGLLAGREVALSRNAPDFTRAGQPLGLPLGDPFVSRKPVVFAPSGERVRAGGGRGRKVHLRG